MNVTGPLLALIAKVLSGASVRWIDCPPDTCQRVYFANHTSHLDALVLWASLPREVRTVTRAVAARDYWERGPVRRHIAASFNVLLIDRENIKVHQSPVEMMLREIGTRYSLIVFPEGGRSDHGEMGEFKSGLYYLAKKRPDLELVPVYMDNLNRVLPRASRHTTRPATPTVRRSCTRCSPEIALVRSMLLNPFMPIAVSRSGPAGQELARSWLNGSK